MSPSSNPPPPWHANLGASRLLARPGDWRLWLINAGAACLWDWRQAGLQGAALAEQLTQAHGLDLAESRRQVGATLRQWRQIGLLGASRPADPLEAAWGLPTAEPSTAWPAQAIRLRLAGHAMGLWVEDPLLRQSLVPWLEAATLPPSHTGGTGPLFKLRGKSAHWRLEVPDKAVESGHGVDAAMLTVLRELTERTCRAAERLLVVHGAGLVGPDGSGLLLIAPGGSGKTTLATALNAEGLPLLHDDVVPVTLDGDLLGLGLPITLKSGSWPILQTLRPDLGETPIRHRLGQPVRLLPPRDPVPSGPVPLGALVFPRYLPGAPAHVQRLTPEAALQGLIEAEAVIRQLTQDKLERLARWSESAPAWSLTYPDLAGGLDGMRRILGQPTGA